MMIDRVAHPSVHNFMDLTGARFGRLVAMYYVGRVNGKPSWFCKCDCSTECVIVTKQLTRKQTRSCGCLLRDTSSRTNLKHGCKGKRVYRIWSGMLNRCRNAASKDFARYGGAGIGVCREWLDFNAFLRDMGEPPTTSHSLDRVDGSKGYCKENCRWATCKEQALNRSSTLKVWLNGRYVSGSDADRELGLYIGKTARMKRKVRA